MQKIRKFLTKYQKEVIATLVFVVSLAIFSLTYAFAAVEPVRSIVITSEHTDYASAEEGSSFYIYSSNLYSDIGFKPVGCSWRQSVGY